LQSDLQSLHFSHVFGLSSIEPGAAFTQHANATKATIATNFFILIFCEVCLFPPPKRKGHQAGTLKLCGTQAMSAMALKTQPQIVQHPIITPPTT
jgi:hypothetical protein